MTEPLFEALREPTAPDLPTRVRFEVPDDPVDYRRGPARAEPAAEGAAPAFWFAEAADIVLELSRRPQGVTADDLHEFYADEPSATHAAVGTLIRRLKKRGLIELVTYRPSRRPERRGSATGVWRAR